MKQSRQAIRTDAAPVPRGAYSQAVRVGDFVFVSGQGPLDPATGQMVGSTVEEQTARVLDNIQAILSAAGATMENVVKATAYLADLSQFARFNEVYARYFPDPKPARSAMGAILPPGMFVSSDVIAYVGEEGG